MWVFQSWETVCYQHLGLGLCLGFGPLFWGRRKKQAQLGYGTSWLSKANHCLCGDLSSGPCDGRGGTPTITTGCSESESGSLLLVQPLLTDHLLLRQDLCPQAQPGMTHWRAGAGLWLQGSLGYWFMAIISSIFISQITGCASGSPQLSAEVLCSAMSHPALRALVHPRTFDAAAKNEVLIHDLSTHSFTYCITQCLLTITQARLWGRCRERTENESDPHSSPGR